MENVFWTVCNNHECCQQDKRDHQFEDRVTATAISTGFHGDLKASGIEIADCIVADCIESEVAGGEVPEDDLSIGFVARAHRTKLTIAESAVSIIRPPLSLDR